MHVLTQKHIFRRWAFFDPGQLPLQHPEWVPIFKNFFSAGYLIKFAPFLAVLHYICFSIYFLQSGGKDLMTGLKSKTNAGRPNWEKIFRKLQNENKGRVTVFYCGNPAVAKILRQKCEEFDFDFRKEVF